MDNMRSEEVQLPAGTGRDVTADRDERTIQQSSFVNTRNVVENIHMIRSGEERRTQNVHVEKKV